jgi:hypothetical protein
MKTSTFLTTTLALSITSAIAISPSAVQAQALTISTPGVYVLSRNINVASGDGILITANNVTLDLGGRSVTTSASGAGRGIVISNAKSVSVKNGKVGGFMMNVVGDTVENFEAANLQITGGGLPPAGGPSEIGFVLVASRGGSIHDNTVTSVSLGLIARGSASVGNRIFNNTFVGSATQANNLLGVCWNPLPGGAATDPGPVGDLAYNNHVSGYRTGISASAGSKNIILRENTIAYFIAPFSASTFATPANNNIDDGNLTTLINP